MLLGLQSNAYAVDIGENITVSGNLRILPIKGSKEKYAAVVLDAPITFNCKMKPESVPPAVFKVNCGNKAEYIINKIQVWDTEDPDARGPEIFPKYHNQHVSVEGNTFSAYAPQIHHTDVLMTVDKIKRE